LLGRNENDLKLLGRNENDLKLLGRNEYDLKNEIKIVQTISKDINMNFGLEKCARICLKRGRVQSKMHIGTTFENDIKELDPRKAYKYLGIEENFDKIGRAHV
jgi:hypothetical protein